MRNVHFRLPSVAQKRCMLKLPNAAKRCQAGSNVSLRLPYVLCVSEGFGLLELPFDALKLFDKS